MGSRVKVLFPERIRLMYRERISIYEEVSGDNPLSAMEDEQRANCKAL